MEGQEALAIEIDKAKIQKVMHIYGTKTERETINQILDDIIYVEKMRATMEKYKGKGTFKKVYE
jgi:Arc/MetJ family transcription regulator